MKRIIVFIPAVVRDRNHVEMIRVQSLLRDRLRRHVDDGVWVGSAVVFDHVAAQYWSEATDLDFNLKFFSAEMIPHAPAITGIRRPVEQFLQRVHICLGGRNDLYLLRVIQDAVVEDAMALAKDLCRLVRDTSGPYMAGELAECDDISHFMRELGLPVRPRYEYAQGAVLFAPCGVWQAHYPFMPAGVTHFCDDSVMSQMVSGAGGKVVPLTRNWEHRHDCASHVSEATFARHQRELAPPH